MIKAVIFDLDDTLFDCSSLLVANARKRAAKALAEAGINLSEKQLVEEQKKLNELNPTSNVFDLIAEKFLSEEKAKDAVKKALEAYNSDVVEEIHLFDGAREMLESLKEKKIKLILITSGITRRQQKKIELLNLRSLMDEIFIHDIETGPDKEKFFVEALKRFNLKPSEVVSVGDRIHSEIRIANKMGMNSVRLLHGRFSKVKPKNVLEEADYSVKFISELPEAINALEKKNGNSELKIVAVGGGTGLPILLNGLKNYTKKITAIVTVMDSGRSSGKLRHDLGVLPPGDIRNCLVALSDSEELMKELFQYRFEGKHELNGHSFGNLFIAALTKLKGNFELALKETSKILAIKGKVVPSTLDDVNLCAELENGKIITGEFNVRKADAKINRMFLSPEPKAFIEAVNSILEADAVVLAPGSFYTSIIPNLLVKELNSALRETKAKKFFVLNIVTQQDQTPNFKASDYLNALNEVLPLEFIDFVVVNNSVPKKRVLDLYEKENSFLVEDDLNQEKLNGTKIIKADLIELIDPEKKRVLWEKVDLLRHDPKKLAETILKEMSNRH
ncbi:MAG: uridine diphosphate-N-acetylglucosamine-binding protein YvcK [archaeon]